MSPYLLNEFCRGIRFSSRGVVDRKALLFASDLQCIKDLQTLLASIDCDMV